MNNQIIFNKKGSSKMPSPLEIIYPTVEGEPYGGLQVAADNKTLYYPEVKIAPTAPVDFATPLPELNTENAHIAHHYAAPRIRMRVNVDNGELVNPHISRLQRRKLQKYLKSDAPTIEGIVETPGEMMYPTPGDLETHWIRKLWKKPKETPITPPNLKLVLEIPVLNPDNTSSVGSYLIGDWGNILGGQYPIGIEPLPYEGGPVSNTPYPVEVDKEQVNGGVRKMWKDQFGHWHREPIPVRKLGGIISYINYLN